MDINILKIVNKFESLILAFTLSKESISPSVLLIFSIRINNGMLINIPYVISDLHDFIYKIRYWANRAEQAPDIDTPRINTWAYIVYFLL